MKKVNIWDSLMKNFIRSFEDMSFHNGGSILSVACSGYSFSPILVWGENRNFKKSLFIKEVYKNADKCMDKSKITRKTVKSKQTRTRESEEYKAEAPKPKALAN
ncbi:hypothetical protein Tco_0191969, partial [Tanacetum coccineum]